MGQTARPVHLGIVERHADEAAFLWTLRDRRARSPLFGLEALTEVDSRLDANLEGLVLAGEHGLAAAQDALERAERRTSDIDGETFTAVHVAAELGDVMTLARLLARAERRPRGARPVVSALAWLSAPAAARILGEMSSEGGPPWLQLLALSARAARREDPGDLLHRALCSSALPLRNRAFRAAGELGRRDLLPVVRGAPRDHDGATAWAPWSAALLGDISAADHLWSLAEAGGPAAEAAAAMAARVSTAAVVNGRIEALASAPGGLSAALAGAAARGDPACIPWVLAAVSTHPGAARRAAWTYATITGAKIEPPLFVRSLEREPGAIEIAPEAEDLQDSLPVPVIDELWAHWTASRSQYHDGERYLGGRALQPAWLEQCLREGPQPWRAAATIELFRASPGAQLFPVLAPGPIQTLLLETRR